MQIFCDESGGADPTNEVFLAAAVVLPTGEAARLLKSFHKAARWDGEVKGHRLTPEQRRIFFDLLQRQSDLGSVVVSCSRRDLLGGWAMGALPEPELYGHLLQEACLSLVGFNVRSVTITPDGGRYKRAELRTIGARLEEAVRESATAASMVTVGFENSASLPGLQVADVVANTAFQALGSTAGSELAGNLLEALRASGRLTLRRVELVARRPAWLSRSQDAEEPPEGDSLGSIGVSSLFLPE